MFTGGHLTFIHIAANMIDWFHRHVFFPHSSLENFPRTFPQPLFFFMLRFQQQSPLKVKLVGQKYFPCSFPFIFFKKIINRLILLIFYGNFTFLSNLCKYYWLNYKCFKIQGEATWKMSLVPYIYRLKILKRAVFASLGRRKGRTMGHTAIPFWHVCKG